MSALFMEKTCYIAETDEHGHIVCVWTQPKGKRTTRVFDPKMHIFDPMTEAQFSGAGPMAIQSWLAARQTQTLSKP